MAHATVRHQLAPVNVLLHRGSGHAHVAGHSIHGKDEFANNMHSAICCWEALWMSIKSKSTGQHV